MNFHSKEVKKQIINESIANRISQGAVIQGELLAETDIRVDGKIIGILNCGAKVVIGESGEFEGEIQSKDATIEGKVVGKLEVNGLLILKRTAFVEGEIYYKRLIVEEGAIISGTLIMSGGTTKQLTPLANSIENKTTSFGATKFAK